MTRRKIDHALLERRVRAPVPLTIVAEIGPAGLPPVTEHEQVPAWLDGWLAILEPDSLRLQGEVQVLAIDFAVDQVMVLVHHQ